MISKKKLFVCLLVFSITQVLYAQHHEIPMRIDTCLHCSGTGINPNFCRICNGTGRSTSRQDGYMCRACAGGLPYICRYCNNGFSSVIDICKGQLNRNVPLWNNLGCLEDIFFIGDAIINETYTIKKHKICNVRSGSIQGQNQKSTSVIYGRDSIMSITMGMMGMADYEDIYILKGGWLTPDSIIICHINEPQMQHFIEKEENPIGTKKGYKVVCENDSTFKGDMTYMITPSHIICGHHEYFFNNGILTKKTSHGKTFSYKYHEFDDHGNWLSRDEYSETIMEHKRQERTINYLK